MNLEEAKANIGKEVVLDESTKPYKNGTLILLISSNDFIKGVLLDVDHYSTAKVDTLDGFHLFINIEHLKLKEQPMNYKIKVTPETSAEVQELFFELGYRWLTQDDDSQEPKYTNTREYIFAYQDNMKLTAPYLGLGKFDLQLNQEITLPQLRDIVVLKRNDVGDATHGAHFSYERFYISENCNKEYVDGKWVNKVSHAMPIPLSELEEPFKEMTWQDALRAVADGKDVEVKNISWFDANDLKLGQLKRGKDFRLKPKTIHIDGGDYTKEELLKIVGEME